MENKYYCIVWINKKRYYLRRQTYYGKFDFYSFNDFDFKMYFSENINDAYLFTKGEKITQRRDLSLLQKRNFIDTYEFIGNYQFYKYIRYFG